MGSNPTRAALFSFLRKKSCLGLVALPFFLFIGVEFSCSLQTATIYDINLIHLMLDNIVLQ